MEQPSLWTRRGACMAAIGARKYNDRLVVEMARQYGRREVDINAAYYQAERTILDLWDLQNR